MNRNELQTYAKLGASKRLSEIQTEVEAILAAFPDLAERRGKRPTTELPVVAPTERKSYKMSAAAKAQVSARMKKYWAERRRVKAADQKESGHRYPKKRPRLINKTGQVVAGTN